MDIDLRNRLRIEWMVIADFAEVVSGKLYLMGGGWDILNGESLPIIRMLGLAIACRVPWNETNQPHLLEFELQDADGKMIAKGGAHFEVGRPPGIPNGQEQRFQVAINIPAVLETAGVYRVLTRVGDDESDTTFRVVAD